MLLSVLCTIKSTHAKAQASHSGSVQHKDGWMVRVKWHFQHASNIMPKAVQHKAHLIHVLG